MNKVPSGYAHVPLGHRRRKALLAQRLAPWCFRKLPVTTGHVLRVESSPLHHRDPFDRLLIAQSIEEGWPIVTANPCFSRYPVEVIW